MLKSAPLAIALLCWLGRAVAADLYVVSFTADWCPNCKILDPALEKALASFGDEIEHITLDMTDDATSAVAFETINGTVLGHVYGDHLGLTGLAVMTAMDSGEKLACATREHDVAELKAIIQAALNSARAQSPGNRTPDLTDCPPPNTKLPL